MRLAHLTVVLALMACGCSVARPQQQASTGDALCDALRDVRAAGLTASLSGSLRLADGDVADERLAEAHDALARFRRAAPREIAKDARRVTKSLERFVTLLNDPRRAPGEMVDWFTQGPRGQERLVASAERVNSVTEDRCGEPLVDPASLDRGTRVPRQ